MSRSLCFNTSTDQICLRVTPLAQQNEEILQTQTYSDAELRAIRAGIQFPNLGNCDRYREAEQLLPQFNAAIQRDDQEAARQISAQAQAICQGTISAAAAAYRS